MNAIRIEGERVILREWRADEAAAMHRWLGDPEVMRFVDFGTTTLQQTQANLQQALEAQRAVERTRYWLAVELRESGETVGDVGLTVEDDGSMPVGNIGWFLERSYWGRGLGTEAARLLVAFAFEELGLPRLRASCDAGNVGSERIMQRCGMMLVRVEPRRSRPGRRLHYALHRGQSARGLGTAQG